MIQFMRGASSAVTSDNPTLQAGQPFYEIDTHKLKIGDGSTAWNDLPYIGGSGEQIKYATVVVGSTTYNSGYTSSDVDYWCDGTDDVSVILEAIASVPYSRGRVIFLDGEYLINSPLNLNISAGSANFIFQGSGFTSFISTSTEGTINADCNNVIFDSISFSHNNSSNLNDTITIPINSTIEFRNCRFSGNYSDNQNCVYADLSDLKFINCEFDLGNETGISLNRPRSCEIASCNFKGFSNTCINITNGSDSSSSYNKYDGVDIHDCYFINSSVIGTGINMPLGRALIHDNHFRYNSCGVSTGLSAGVNDFAPSITSNYFYNCTQGVLLNANNSIAANNVFYTCDQAIVTNADARYQLVCNNLIFNNSSSDIGIQSTASYSVFVGNLNYRAASSVPSGSGNVIYGNYGLD